MTMARDTWPRSDQTTRGHLVLALSVRNNAHHGPRPRVSVRAASRWRHGASQLAAAGGSVGIGASVPVSRSSCVQRIHSGACAYGCVAFHPRMFRPRTTGRSIVRSTSPTRGAAPELAVRTRATSSSGESCGSSETRNASLHPLLTPSSGWPKTVSDSGTPAAATASNAWRVSGGTSSQGLPGDASRGRAAGGSLHRRAPPGECTAAAIAPGSTGWSVNWVVRRPRPGDGLAGFSCPLPAATDRRPHRTPSEPQTSLRASGWSFPA